MSITKTTKLNKTKNISVESKISELGNGWLKKYNLKYQMENHSINEDIRNALQEYKSKAGKNGGNIPDSQMIFQDPITQKHYPVMIEYKGYEKKLVKLDKEGYVENVTSKNEAHYANIKGFAVNGAVHYANAILEHTTYEKVIAIGMTGHEDSTGELRHSIGVYLVSKSNLGIGKKIGEYSDFSFLKQENLVNFIKEMKKVDLTEKELTAITIRKEAEIDSQLKRLNNDIYENEKGLSENDRVYLIVSTIIATLGVSSDEEGEGVSPLTKSDLKSSNSTGDDTDGATVLRKVKAFLNAKKIPKSKKELILRNLQNTLTSDNINKVIDGSTQMKRVFSKIVDSIGIYYKIGLTTDFTGRLFNEMYSWLGFSEDKLNDVVLTPSSVSTMLAKLAMVNKDSHVWDFATGSASLLVASMNEMLKDAKKNIKSPEELMIKEAKIKSEQLLGLEILSDVYMLAVLNMILMGDGSSNILNEDSLSFDGNYGFNKEGKFKANAFLLNPPYSADGNGMVFVEKGLSMMDSGRAAIIIQGSTGSGKAVGYNRRILEKNTLVASIKMPIDIFIGKASVQTYIYVFDVGVPHTPNKVVKFIDFSNDGYTRSNRKKASVNIKNTDHGVERYQEIIDLVLDNHLKTNFFTEKEYYRGSIDPLNGADWNQSAPIDTKPTLDDFKKTVGDYLSWEVSSLLKQRGEEGK